MSIDLGAGQHPLLSRLQAIDGLLDEVALADPMFMRTEDKKAALTLHAQLDGRMAAVKMRLLATADDVAVETGDRSTASWPANETRDSHGATRRSAKLAEALDRRWRLVGHVLAAGDVNAAQAHVITHALDALPQDLDPVLRERAEAHLVAEAARFGPRDLARLGERVLEAIAPEVAEEAE